MKNLKKCSVENCDKKVRCKNLCKSHYELNLKYGRTNKIRFVKKNIENHGKSQLREYSIWRNMIQRCTNKKNERFSRYGGRNINVCEEWKNSFEKFYLDMGPCPEKFQIDRINNDQGYFKENCKWSSVSENCQNRSTSKLNKDQVIEIKKSELSSYRLAKIFGVSAHTIKCIKKNKIWKNV